MIRCFLACGIHIIEAINFKTFDGHKIVYLYVYVCEKFLGVDYQDLTVHICYLNVRISVTIKIRTEIIRGELTKLDYQSEFDSCLNLS